MEQKLFLLKHLELGEVEFPEELQDLLNSG